MAKEIFISYSRKDFDKVKTIKEELDRELGINCWMDLDGIESGDQFETKIIDAINSHRFFLFMLSPNSMASEFALKELDFAHTKGKRIIFVYITPCQMTDHFLFNYKKNDTIDWGNSLQHDKLLNNLRNWLSNDPSSLRNLAESGDLDAQYHLGYNYFYGTGVSQDFYEAAKWLQKSAERGHAGAQSLLGWLYEHGEGVLKDIPEAIKWFTLAAEQGDVLCQRKLGDYNHNAKNYQEAFKWYMKAAEQGYDVGQKLVGDYYAWGFGVPQDLHEAAKWYRKAAEQGHATAIKWLQDHSEY